MHARDGRTDDTAPAERPAARLASRGRRVSRAALHVLDGADRPALRAQPSKLFVEVTTRCNLRCEMCPREAPGRTIVDGDMTRETFARLAPAFPRLDALVLNGIGEPLLHPHLDRFVEEARRAMPDSGW